MVRKVIVLAVLLAGCDGATGDATSSDAAVGAADTALAADTSVTADTAVTADTTPAADVQAGADAQDAGPSRSDDAGARAAADTTPAEDATPDAGAQDGPPAPRAYSGAHGCPKLVAGKNTIQSANQDRSFLLYLPDEPQGAPLLTLWHPAGGTASYMASAFGAAKLAKDYGLIVAVPDSCCGLVEWRFRDTEDPTADLTLFDDLVSCTDEQFDIDNARVYTGGFSAGGLWSSYLVVHRSEYLAAAVIFSGGVDGLISWETPARPVPTLLSWGGAVDVLYGVFSFDQQMKALSGHLHDEGAFVIECDHGGGHTVPPGATSWSVPFALAHTWGEPSPFAASGLDASFPDYCVVPQ